MNLDQLATTIGASTEVAESLLETYSIDLANITTREVESLKTVANPGSLATKPQKKAPAKQLEGGNTSVLTQGTTATLTAPEAPTIETNAVLPSMDLEGVKAHFEALTVGASMQVENAARSGIISGATISQGEASITDNLFRTVITNHHQARLPQQ